MVKIQNGSNSLETTSKKIDSINESTQRLGTFISGISKASVEQSAGITAATKSIAEMESVTQAAAASAEETAASANTLEPYRETAPTLPFRNRDLQMLPILSPRFLFKSQRSRFVPW